MACAPTGDPGEEDSGTSTSDSELDPPPGSLLADPLAEFPARLSQVGLYLQLPARDVVPAVAVAFEPAWPLWSSGSVKQRHIIVPPGQPATVDGDAWEVAPGTIFSKTFAYLDDQGHEVPVETRLLRRDGAGAWDYATYRWEGDDASLLDMKAPVEVAVPGGVHTIPSRVQCRMCHESASRAPLGFDATQLAAATTTLAERGVFAAAPTPAPLAHPDPRTREVLGYFYGNCIHCHNGEFGDNNSFDLRPAVALDNLIDVETAGSASVAGIRVVPGSPEMSVLWQAVRRDSEDPDLEPMPPVGIDAVDAGAVELLRAWISDLPE